MSDDNFQKFLDEELAKIADEGLKVQREKELRLEYSELTPLERKKLVETTSPNYERALKEMLGDNRISPREATSRYNKNK
ncbi:MAG: hypothetical protein PHQ18_05590 [Patescibacteria group bacterium]|nr:hypothetical protein [Patescibacteria group bacterium]